jgi:hypothetical protein
MREEPSGLASAVGGSACPHADETLARAIALGTTRSATNALRTAHATASRTSAFTLAKQRERISAFTLAELIVSVGVLVLLVLLATQLFNSAAIITTLDHKQMDADSQARQLLDRMAIDFAQMVKRSDVDYYVKSNPPLGLIPPRIVLQPGNDRIAFYSAVPGYYPSTGSQSPVSLVAYRVNSVSTSSAYNKTERLGKGLVWNAVSTTDTPVVFIPIPLASPLPATDLPVPPPNPLPLPAWPEASNATTSWSDSEVIGPQVFRFEYYYLLKNGSFSGIPWISPIHSSISGMQDVSAIVVNIAVIDPRSKVLLGSTEAQINAQIATLAGTLIDYRASAAAGCPTPNWSNAGELRRQWQCALDGTTVTPRAAVSGIRLYERFIYLSPPVL